jgi:glycosyltransferase involved in cell wall biosynthesis
VTPKGILYLDHAQALGGAEYSLLLLLKHLDRARFRPTLACNPGPLVEAVGDLDVKTILVDMPKLRGELAAPIHLMRGGLALARIIRRDKVALVHSNVMRASIYAALAARLTGRPLIWHVRDIHAPGQPGGAWYPRLMCRLADRAIAISNAVAVELPCQSRVVVVYNGLDLVRFDPHLDGIPVRVELGLPPDAPVVGIVGRVWPWKGQADFLRAAAEVTRTHPAARFIVVGAPVFAADRDYLGELKVMAAGLGIGERVVFTGFRHDVARMLAAMDVVVHCSRAEPFGRVLIEAMAMARPVVAYADGGVPEIVLDGQTGLLVQPGDVVGLAEAVSILLNDSGRARMMGRRGRARVEAFFDARQTAHAVEAIYEEILSRP